MSKKDELDQQGAAAYAWRFHRPEDRPLEEKEVPSISEEEIREAGAALARAARSSGNAFASAVERVWQLPEAEQLPATLHLLESAVDAGVRLAGMDAHPRASVRFFRLLLRARAQISAESLPSVFMVSLWLGFAHPELVELMAEVIEAEEASFAGAVALSCERQLGSIARVPRIGAEIARLLASASTVEGARVAMFWAGLVQGPELVEPLRRQLRRPHFALRAQALCLLAAHFPESLTKQDVLFLLEDTVDHPPPRIPGDVENEDAFHQYGGLLEHVTGKVRPEGGEAPLMRIFRGDCVKRRGFRIMETLDGHWALCVLASAYPSAALGPIDRGLRSVENFMREGAAHAAGRLSEELAQPRLRLAAADGAAEVAKVAEEIWLRRWGRRCPLSPLEGLESQLLSDPPSEIFTTRLLVMRGGSQAARAAMAEALLSEAPAAEALVLLLFAAADDRLWRSGVRPGLPEGRASLYRALVEGFGAPAVAGIRALDARYPEGARRHLDELAGAFSGTQAIPEEAAPALRETFLDALSKEGGSRRSWLLLLAKLGVPAETFEVLRRIALHDDSLFVREVAVDLIASLHEEGGAVEESILEEMRSAQEAGDRERLARAAEVGVRCRIPDAVAMVRRQVEEHGDLPDAEPEEGSVVRDAYSRGVELLRRHELLPEGWYAEALASPGTLAYSAALLGRGKNEPPELVEERLRALESAPIALATLNARFLLMHREIEAEDPRILALLLRVPPKEAAELLGAMLFRGADPRRHWARIEAYLRSPDPEQAAPMGTVLYTISLAGLDEELRAIAPEVVEPELRARLREWLGPRPDQVGYWVDEAHRNEAPLFFEAAMLAALPPAEEGDEG